MSAPVDWATLLADPHVHETIERALREDIGAGDVTTASLMSSAVSGRARVFTREATVVCGGPLAAHLLRRLDPRAAVQLPLAEGAQAQAGATLLEVHADVRAILTAERTVLNFLMRLCGIAYATAAAVRAVPAGCKARIYDTRKTTPTLRALEKAAVRTGGGCNHRMGLYDAALIKDNHLLTCGIEEAVARVRRGAPHVSVELEIDNLMQLDTALRARPDIILLDNFAPEQLSEAVRRVAGRCQTEASGGVTLETIPAIARSGVDRISMGALTHSVRAANLSLELLV